MLCCRSVSVPLPWTRERSRTMSRERVSSSPPDATKKPLPFPSISTPRTVMCSPRSMKMPAALSVYGNVCPSDAVDETARLTIDVGVVHRRPCRGVLTVEHGELAIGSGDATHDDRLLGGALPT